LFFGFSTLYIKIQILVTLNNHEYGVLMNCKGRCVYNQCKNYECVHIIMQICCYNKCGIGLHGFNPHLPILYNLHVFEAKAQHYSQNVMGLGLIVKWNKCQKRG